MPLYKPTDEKLLELLANHGCEVDIDQSEGQCYWVHKIGDESLRSAVNFGGSLVEFETACGAVLGAHAATAPAVASDGAANVAE